MTSMELSLAPGEATSAAKHYNRGGRNILIELVRSVQRNDDRYETSHCEEHRDRAWETQHHRRNCCSEQRQPAATHHSHAPRIPIKIQSNCIHVDVRFARVHVSANQSLQTIVAK